VYQDTGGAASGMAVPRHPRGLTPTGRLAAGVLLTLVMIVLAPARPAAAHALLLASDPPNGATLATSPRVARLWFSEEIATKFRSVRLVDSTGRPIAGVSVATGTGNPRLVVAELPPLPPGAYGLVWQALSADDGHPTSGVIVFAVGRAATGSVVAAEAGQSAAGGGIAAVVRWLYLCLVAGLIGAVAVAWLVRRGTAETDREPARARRRLLGFAAGCAALAVTIGVLDLIEQAIRVAPTLSTRPGAPLPVVGRLLTASRWGELWVAREAVLLALAAVVVGLRQGRRRRALPVIAGLLILAVAGLEAMDSHAAALDSGRTAAVVAIAAHTLAACLWLGGVAALAVIAWPPGSGGTAVVRANLGRFTILAALSVGLVAATGLYSAGRQLDSAGSLVSTGYGRTLLVKTALLFVLLGLGLANSGLLRLRFRGARGAAGKLPSRRLLALEAGAGVVLLLAVGVLTETPPPRATAAPVRPTGRTVSGLAADLVVTVTVSPDRPGVNGFTVLVSSSRRPPPAPIEDVALNLTAGGVTSPVPAQQLEPGRYFGTTAVDAPGPARLTVVVQRHGQFLTVPVDWSVPDAAPGAAGGGPFVPVVNTLAAGILGVLLSAGGWWLLRRRRQHRQDPDRVETPDAQPDRVAQRSLR
jgi:copper transport protein